MSTFIDKKYINLVSAQLQRFKWKSDNTANCRCPICGDSQKSKTKARGFFFVKKNDYFYKCHNCGIGHSMFRFLEFVSPALAQEYSVERWKNGENNKSNYVKPDEVVVVLPKATIRLPKVSLLDPDHMARVYLESRKIPDMSLFYFAKEFGKWVQSIDATYGNLPNDERIVIPFINKAGELVAAQGRSLVDSKNTIRYITVKFCKEGRAIFGEDRIDYSKRVYVVEGPIDSVFLDNGVALAGSELTNSVRLFNDCVVVYDNEPRNKQIVDHIAAAIAKGYTVCIWDGVEHKDINDMILSGMTPQDIQEIIDHNSVSGLTANLKLNAWKRI